MYWWSGHCPNGDWLGGVTSVPGQGCICVCGQVVDNDLNNARYIVGSKGRFSCVGGVMLWLLVFLLQVQGPVTLDHELAGGVDGLCSCCRRVRILFVGLVTVSDNPIIIATYACSIGRLKG